MDSAAKNADNYTQKQSDLRKEMLAGRISFDQYREQAQKLSTEASRSTDVFTKLGIAVRDGSGQLRSSEDVLLDFADAFKQLPDGAEKTALAMEAFGRRASRMVPFLNQGSDGIRQLEEQAQRVAPPLTKLQQDVFDKMGDSFDTLSKAARSALDNVLVKFAPAITKAVEGITEFIASNRDAFAKIADQIATKVTPIVSALISVLKDGITNAVLPAFQGLLAILDKVATAINAVFGTNLSGGTIALGAVVLQMVGLFGVLGSAVSAVVTGIGLLVAAFGGIPVIIAAVAIALGAFIVSAAGGVDGIKNAWTTAWTAIGDFVKSVFDGVKSAVDSFVSGVNALWQKLVDAAKAAASGVADLFSKALSTVNDGFTKLSEFVSGIFEKIVNAAKSVASAISSITGGSGSGSGENLQGFAGGGRVVGPGTSRSDSILARLSAGEFVINARAVRRYGARLFDAFNKMRVPAAALSGVSLDGITAALATLVPQNGRYADGGLALAAAGGASGHPLTLNIGGESIGGLIASSNAVDQIMRFAAGKQLRSSGRKPLWYRG
jgi:hypothetical protein